jgi:hypothetical protein
MTDFVELLEAQLVNAHSRRRRMRRHLPSRRTSGALMLATVAAAALVVVIVGLASPNGGTRPAHPASRATTAPTATAPVAGARRATTPPTATAVPVPSTVPVAPPAKLPFTVAVLNATRERGVARSAADRLFRAGYRVGVVTNAPGPSRARSVVLYKPGSRAAAVALAIRLRVPRVGPVTPGIRGSVADHATVVFVVLGADHSRRARGTGSRRTTAG